MRTIRILLMVFFSAGLSHSQPDSLFVKFAGDTVKVWNVGVTANCASRFRFDIFQSPDTLTIFEVDTIGPLVRCICTFDLCASLTGLRPGTYAVEVHRRLLKQYHYPRDTTLFIGTTFFTLPVAGLPARSVALYQSPCYHTSALDEPASRPRSFTLRVNYPNPFNPETIIEYSLSTAGHVLLRVFDVLGHEVITLVDGKKPEGNHTVRLGADQLAGSGVYFYRLTAGGVSETRAMVLSK